MGFIIFTLHINYTLWQHVWSDNILALITHFLFLLVSLNVLTPTYQLARSWGYNGDRLSSCSAIWSVSNSLYIYKYRSSEQKSSESSLALHSWIYSGRSCKLFLSIKKRHSIGMSQGYLYAQVYREEDKCSITGTGQTEIFTPARHWPCPGPFNNC